MKTWSSFSIFFFYAWLVWSVVILPHENFHFLVFPLQLLILPDRWVYEYNECENDVDANNETSD